MSTDLARVDSYTAAPLEQRMRYAQTLAAAPIIPKALRRGGPDGAIETAANVLLVFETGSMLGLHPIAALQGIHVIEGKATLSAQLMNAQVRKHGHTLVLESTGKVITDAKGNPAPNSDYHVRATLTRGDDGTVHTSEWDYQRSLRAGLLAKDNWRNYFEGMATSRVISEVCRQGAPDALMGIVYTAEELGANVNGDGEVIDEYVQPQSSNPQHAPIGEQSQPQQSAPQLTDEQRAAVADWVAKCDAATTKAEVGAVYQEARAAGVMGLPVQFNEQIIELGTYIVKTGEAFAAAESAQQSAPTEDVVDAEIVDEPGAGDGPAAVLDPEA